MPRLGQLGQPDRVERAAGQRPRCEERARPAQNRQTRRGLAGQADREGAAAALVRAAGADPAAARLHPAAGGSDPGTHPLLAAAGEAARRRADQAVAVASTLDTLSARDMIEALIAGERDPRRLADLARGRMRTKRSALIKALDGRFDDHHAELARMLLDQIDALTRPDRHPHHPHRAPAGRDGRRRHRTTRATARPRAPRATTSQRPPARADHGRTPRRNPRHRPGAPRRSSSPRSAWT